MIHLVCPGNKMTVVTLFVFSNVHHLNLRLLTLEGVAEPLSSQHKQKGSYGKVHKRTNQGAKHLFSLKPHNSAQLNPELGLLFVYRVWCPGSLVSFHFQKPCFLMER